MSVWAIESATQPNHVGLWVICGDLPTDNLGREHASDPRQAVRCFAERWQRLAPLLAEGTADPEIRIGADPAERKMLAPLLKARAELLARWAEEDLWDFDDD